MKRRLMPWSHCLQSARAMPEFYIGSLPKAHLLAVAEPTALACSGILGEPDRIIILLGRSSYRIEIRVEEHQDQALHTLRFDRCDVIIAELLAAGVGHLEGSPPKNADVPCQERIPLSVLAGPLVFATSGIITFRIGETLWSQVYRDGWPVTPPVRRNSKSDECFVIQARLSTTWFPGLPFVLEEVEETVSDLVRSQHARDASGIMEIHLTDKELRSFAASSAG
jgi:hypothetical protein